MPLNPVERFMLKFINKDIRSTGQLEAFKVNKKGSRTMSVFVVLMSL